jgi:hypothetical protein
MKTTRLAVLSVFSLLFSLPIQAAEYHVAPGIPGAADDNPGTLAKPWKTIATAAATARAGDTVLIHAGTYPEFVMIKNAGDADKPITFQAIADDEVILEGADSFGADKWQLATNAKNIYATALDREPGQLFVDGKAVYPKVDQTRKVYPRTYKLGVLTDADKRLYQYDPKTKQLLLNLGGDTPARHVIRVPVRMTAFKLSAHCRLAGIRARNYMGTAIEVGGDDSIVEDCLVTDSGGGVWVNGWDRSGVIVRRNTVIGALGNGIYLQDRPTHCFVEDNLVVRCTLNPAHDDGWIGSIKMNAASDSIFAHNVVLEGGNPETDGGHDGWAMWGDIDIVRIWYLGNSCANNKAAGLYVEYTMGDTRAYFNTSYRDGGGITCRQSQRGVFMRNLLLESRGSGFAVWEGAAPYSTTDHIFAHNLVRDCNPAIWLAIEHPNFADYNTYWPRKDAPIAWGETPKGARPPQYKELADWVKATGHDLHSQVKDAQPADVGLDTVTFRVADAKDPKQVLMMVGNGGCEYEDPAGQNILPYFWRPGSGDGVEHKFPYAAYCSLKGGTEAMAYRGAGGTVAFPLDSPSDPNQPKFAHGGLRYLKFDGQKPADMCKQGLGFWSPSLPARVADTYDISFFVRGLDLKPAGAAAIAAFVEFADATGQHRQRLALRTGIAAGKPLAGTFDWTQLAAEVKVPDSAKRMRVFIGLLPATGQLLLDDVSIKVR